MPKHKKEGSVTSQYEASEADVKAWLKDIKMQIGDDKRRVLNKKAIRNS